MCRPSVVAHTCNPRAGMLKQEASLGLILKTALMTLPLHPPPPPQTLTITQKNKKPVSVAWIRSVDCPGHRELNGACLNGGKVAGLVKQKEVL